ncbi:glycosyltransferase, partial [Planctomycetota bacterium]
LTLNGGSMPSILERLSGVNNPWALWLFWSGLAVLFYAYVGYPLVLALLSALLGKRVQKGGAQPAVAIVIAVFNGQEFVAAKLENLLAQEYGGRINIYLAADGCTDATVQEAEAFENVRVIPYPVRAGKAATLNKIMKELTEEIVILTDIRQQFAPDAVAALVANFEDPSIGAVSGEYYMLAEENTQMKGVDLYWRIEKFLRRHEAKLYSTVGATGAIYAIRRTCYRDIPGDALIDDVTIPLQINARGLRTVFEPAAIATDSFSVWEREQARKVRTMAGNFQMVLKPWKYGNPYQWRLLFQFLSHKFLRLWIPLVLLSVVTANAMLLDEYPFYFYFGILQGACYVLGITGMILGKRARKWKIIAIPGTFLMLNISVVAGFWYYLRKKGSRGWD